MRQRKTSLAPGYLVTNVPVSLPLKSSLLSRDLLILKSQVLGSNFPQGFPTSSINEGHPAAIDEGWQVTAEDLAQLSPYLTSHILRFGAYGTDELHIPPDVFDPALDEVDFGGEQPSAA